MVMETKTPLGSSLRMENEMPLESPWVGDELINCCTTTNPMFLFLFLRLFRTSSPVKKEDNKKE